MLRTSTSLGQRPRLMRAGRLGFEALEPRHVLSAANLQITEFMATNTSTLLNGDFAYDDWIEVYNADTTPVDLGDYYLSDNLADPTKWAMPSLSLPPGAYLVVFASAPLDSNGQVIQDYVDGFGDYHASFKLDSTGEGLALTYEDPSTSVVSVVSQYAPEFPPQFPDVSYGIASDGQPRYFDAPTPGGPNGAGLQGVVEDTKFSVDRGFYDTPFQLEISSLTPGAAIYYTTDGTQPVPGASVLYTGPLTIDHTTVLRAAAFKSGYLPTNVDTQTYLFLEDVVSQTRQTALDAGYPAFWEALNGTYEADYGFDPDVIGQFDASGAPLGGDLFGGLYAAQLQQSLLAAPTISIVMDPDDLFLQDNSDVDGIYIDPRQGRNPEPERATSVEWITPDGAAEFQVDSGIQMQGGAFRSQFFTRKHSFRLV
ncbi:MAG: chitobiase/beta-hexosaminidase C-terminal domain-containing protein, partial [Planctomycetales bacterium]|nr:chitobiase/beta-hexosaminidase C-terminal domain-containing protein [Planctomycetales bacterium]